jgi:hypothetical protein
MTVCIAAMAHKYIVAVSDMMLSGFVLGSDGSCVKQEAVSKGWTAMMSGNDISHAVPIVTRASEYLEGKPSTLENARSCFKRAFQQRLTEVATDRVLGRFGLDMKAFLKDGRRLFDAGTFTALCNEIRSVDLADLSFLVYGFDDSQAPHIFVVQGTGEDVVYDKVGFAAIGSGMYAADSLLHYLNQSRGRTLRETIANALVAKFLAERSGGVGHETHLFVSEHGSVAFSHKPGYVEEIRNEWEACGAPRIPQRVEEILERANIKCLTSEQALEELKAGLGSTTADLSPQSPSQG